MKKSFLVGILGVTGVVAALSLSSCISGDESSKRSGYSSAACREKCERLGQTVAVAASADAGKCVCLAESRRGDN